MDNKARHKHVTLSVDVLDERVLPAAVIVPVEPIPVTDASDPAPVSAEVAPTFPTIGGVDGDVMARDAAVPTFPSIGGVDGGVMARDAVAPTAPTFPTIGGVDGDVMARGAAVPTFPTIGGVDGDVMARDVTVPTFPTIGGVDGDVMAREVAPSVQPEVIDPIDPAVPVAAALAQPSTPQSGQPAASTDTPTQSQSPAKAETVAIKRPRKLRAARQQGKAWHRAFKMTGAGTIQRRVNIQIVKG